MVTGQSTRKAAMPDESVIGAGLSHAVFFYRDQRDYVARIREFSCAGLDKDEPVFIAVPGRNGALLRERMGVGAGPVHFADMAVFGRNPARIIPEVRAFADSCPGQRIRFVGEPIWPGRSAAEICEATRNEALVNQAFEPASATILCLYNVAGLPEEVIADARRTHPVLISGGRSERSRLFAGPDGMPAGCDYPLPGVPAGATVASYAQDLHAVRALVRDEARLAGLPHSRT